MAAAIAQLKSAALKQEAVNAEQRKEMEALTASLQEQASQIQKVSVQIELSKLAPQMVVNHD
jgi:DNA-binding protein H-NS